MSGGDPMRSKGGGDPSAGAIPKPLAAPEAATLRAAAINWAAATHRAATAQSTARIPELLLAPAIPCVAAALLAPAIPWAVAGGTPRRVVGRAARAVEGRLAPARSEKVRRPAQILRWGRHRPCGVRDWHRADTAHVVTQKRKGQGPTAPWRHHSVWPRMVSAAKLRLFCESSTCHAGRLVDAEATPMASVRSGVGPPHEIWGRRRLRGHGAGHGAGACVDTGRLQSAPVDIGHAVGAGHPAGADHSADMGHVCCRRQPRGPSHGTAMGRRTRAEPSGGA